MSRGVFVDHWILEELGASPPALMLAQMFFLTNHDRARIVVRADHEWSDLGISADQAYRARRRLVDAGWIGVEVRMNGRAPVVHMWITDSAQARNPDRGSAESTSLSTTAQKRRRIEGERALWPHGVESVGARHHEVRRNPCEVCDGTLWLVADDDVARPCPCQRSAAM